ncbi:MAG: hypothetical protein ABI836_02915 [Gemmatimonadota bacterium]
MEDILAIVFLFGGAAVVGISFSPLGRALADRIRGRSAGPVPDPQVYEELDQLRHELSELQERVDFTERMLAKGREAGQLEQ